MPFIPNGAELDFRFIIRPGGDRVDFPAYLNNFNIRYSPAWQLYKEVGRADAKVLYNEFMKELDLDFHVVAEGNGVTTRLNFEDRLEVLNKAVAPTYYPGLGYQGNFVEFTIGNVYRNEIGYVTNLQYSIENDKTSWRDQRPMLIRVNMTIAWVGKRIPQASTPFFVRGGQQTA